jgi:uncharacterized membrane protein
MLRTLLWVVVLLAVAYAFVSPAIPAPITAFRAVRAAQAIFLMLALWGSLLIGLIQTAFLFRRFEALNDFFAPSEPPSLSSLLRC